MLQMLKQDIVRSPVPPKIIRIATMQLRGGSRGRVQAVRTPPPPEMTCGFLIKLVFCKKKDYVVYWC